MLASRRGVAALMEAVCRGTPAAVGLGEGAGQSLTGANERNMSNASSSGSLDAAQALGRPLPRRAQTPALQPGPPGARSNSEFPALQRRYSSTPESVDVSPASFYDVGMSTNIRWQATAVTRAQKARPRGIAAQTPWRQYQLRHERGARSFARRRGFWARRAASFGSRA